MELNFLKSPVDGPVLYLVLKHLMMGASATLVRLTLGLGPSLVVSLLPPLDLPSLTHLELSAPNPFSDLSQFINSPVRRLAFKGTPWSSRDYAYRGHSIVGTLLKPLRNTLERTSGDFEYIEVSDEDAEAIEKWCLDAGVELD